MYVCMYVYVYVYSTAVAALLRRELLPLPLLPLLHHVRRRGRRSNSAGDRGGRGRRAGGWNSMIVVRGEMGGDGGFSSESPSESNGQITVPNLTSRLQGQWRHDARYVTSLREATVRARTQ